MFSYTKGIPFRSRPVTYGNGQSTNVDLSFLHSPNQRMRAPVVREIALHFSGNLSGTTGGFVSTDACQIYSKIEIRDRGGVIHDLPGKLVRQRQLIELGRRADLDTDFGGDIASGATNTAYNFMLRIPFDLENARNGADTALPLWHLVDGGEILLSFGTPAASVVTSGTVTVYVIVHDEMYKEVKSRLVVKTFAMTVTEDDYTLNGSTRILVISSNPAATGYSDWTLATYPTIDVPELEYSNLSTFVLRSEYRRVRNEPSTVDPTFAGGPDGIPLIWPSRGQRIDKLPDLKSVRIRLPTTPAASAQLLACWIEDRYPALAAGWLGYSDIQSYIEAANKYGKLKLGDGKLADPASVPGNVAKRLPMVIG